jgi:hypothetical protein
MIRNNKRQENLKFNPKKRKKLDMDSYIEFLTISNAMFNHRRKRFVKMEGNCFKM